MYFNLIRFFALVTAFVALPSNGFAESTICLSKDQCYSDCCKQFGDCSSIPHSSGSNNSLYCANSCGGVKATACTAGLYCKFNTNASEYNFLEVTNRTNRTMHGQVEFLNNSRVVVGGTIRLQLAPFQRKDLDIHSMVGQNRYGQVLLKVGSTTTVAEVGASVSHYYSSNGKL